MEKTDTQRSILATLCNRIGQHLIFQQQRYQLIEVLESEMALILRSEQDAKTIQPDQYGHAQRRVEKTVTITVFSNDGDHFHDNFKKLCEDNGISHAGLEPH